MPVAEEITQSEDKVRMKLVSQLIKSILRVLQKILKCFNGNSFLTTFILPAAGVVPIILTLNSNDLESAKIVFG